MNMILCQARIQHDGHWHVCVLLGNHTSCHECLCGQWDLLVDFVPDPVEAA